MESEELPPELQEIADLLWEHAHGAPPLEEDKVWQRFFANKTEGMEMHTLLELKRAEDAGEICAMEDATQSVMCLYEPLHAGRHSWEPFTDEDDATGSAS